MHRVNGFTRGVRKLSSLTCFNTFHKVIVCLFLDIIVDFRRRNVIFLFL